MHLAMDETGTAFSSLAKACDEREGELICVASDPRLDKLRADRRYADLLVTVELQGASELKASAWRPVFKGVARTEGTSCFGPPLAGQTSPNFLP